MSVTVSTTALDQAFLTARTFKRFTSQPVADDTLRELYDLVKWGPTSMNTQPARYVFVKSAEAKDRLKGALMAGNVEKTMAAPVTVIVACDREFYEHLPTQSPSSASARDRMAANPTAATKTGTFNSTLQAAYLMIGARLLGLDCGAMAGFDADKVNAEFFPDGRWQSTLLINLGYGDASGNYPRGPRLAFDEVARIA